MSPSLYDFHGHSIRVVQIDNAPWFIAADVCKALTVGNTTDATLNLDLIEVQNYRVPGTKGRPNKIVSESGLYKIVLRSDKPDAKAFQAWVTGTVLPAIRKDGGFGIFRRRFL
ncbi:Bro-N domain-containing protein [Rhodobacter lacus]|uniref:Bro-N domain-containing protein n=1 Tax=Rhodobacter lacus TaxID=1641972 RepID=A0ABW5A6T5_9RHOB